MLRAFGPALLHALQNQLQAALVDVRCNVEAPFEVLPPGEARLEHVGAHGLGVPAPADEGQAVQHALAVVAGQVDAGEIKYPGLISPSQTYHSLNSGTGLSRLSRRKRWRCSDSSQPATARALL